MSGALHRVRYTGANLYMVTGFEVVADGIRLSFSRPLNPESAADPKFYHVQQWNYRWTSNYGSPGFSIKNPDQKGRDQINVKRVTLSDDLKSVVLHIQDIQPVDQSGIRASLLDLECAHFETSLFGTVH